MIVKIKSHDLQKKEQDAKGIRKKDLTVNLLELILVEYIRLLVILIKNNNNNNNKASISKSECTK